MPLSCLEVCLQAAQDVRAPFLGFLEAPVLHARVAAVDHVFELELEVVHFALAPDQEGVRGDRILGARAPYDHSVFHGPEFRVAVPPLQGNPVKDWDKATGRLGCWERAGRRQAGRNKEDWSKGHDREPAVRGGRELPYDSLTMFGSAVRVCPFSVPAIGGESKAGRRRRTEARSLSRSAARACDMWNTESSGSVAATERL